MTAVVNGPGSWLRRFATAGEAAPRLVCFPHAGGSASFYRPFAQALSPAIDVLAVQYPGRQDRRAEPCLTAIPVLAGLICDVLAGVLDRPVAFLGHSMGAVVAFEVARLLQPGWPGQPVRLFVAGRRAPTRWRPEDIHTRDDDGVVAAVKALGSAESSLLDDDEIRAMALPAIRADYRAVETYEYRPGEPLSCPITALIGADDPLVSLKEARDWEQQAPPGAFDLRVLPGGHFFLAQHASAIVPALVKACLTSRPGAGLRPQAEVER
jgi:surfactin synthase thioesterase subunit